MAKEKKSTKAVAVKDTGTELSDQKPQWSPAQIQLIQNTVAKNTTADQFKWFLYQCQRTGLDPLAKQIHCVVRQTKDGPQMAIQTGIDGLRVIAERSGKYVGQTKVEYGPKNNSGYPEWAEIGVYKHYRGMKNDVHGDWEKVHPVYGRAYWNEYVQQYNGRVGTMWAKMPHLMLAKCAEALALRKAFPQDLSGVYTTDEMGQAENGQQTEQVQKVQIEQKASASQIAEMVRMLGDLGHDMKFFEEQAGKRMDEMSKREIDAYIKQAKKAVDNIGTDAEGPQKEPSSNIPIVESDTEKIEPSKEELATSVEQGELPKAKPKVSSKKVAESARRQA